MSFVKYWDQLVIDHHKQSENKIIKTNGCEDKLKTEKKIYKMKTTIPLRFNDFNNIILR